MFPRFDGLLQFLVTVAVKHIDPCLLLLLCDLENISFFVLNEENIGTVDENKQILGILKCTNNYNLISFQIV